MASTQLVKVRKRPHVAVAAVDDNTLGLEDYQVRALERLAELGETPAEFDEEKQLYVWSKNRKVRAYQLLAAGKIGGTRNGAGRPAKQPRAAEELATYVRTDLVKPMKEGLRRALSPKAGVRANLDAIKLAQEIENRERKLQIEEEEHEGNIGNTREELIATLIAIVTDPTTEAAIEGTSEDITEAIVISDDNEQYAFGEGEAQANGSGRPARTPRRKAVAASFDGSGGDRRRLGPNGRARATRDRTESTNPITQAALRRAAQRR